MHIFQISETNQGIHEFQKLSNITVRFFFLIKLFRKIWKKIASKRLSSLADKIFTLAEKLIVL